MRRYLLFRLYGPMASWGDIAVGEYRPSFFHPSKSAIFGLVEAALGIERSDDHAHQQMVRSYGFAVRLDASGSLLRDYHTVQVPSTSRNAFFLSRKEELEAEKKGTVLSFRDYYCDTLSFPCLWTKGESPPYTLEEIQNALERPYFPLYLGRKSCPPALPLVPQVVEAPTLDLAFRKYPIQEVESKANFLHGLPKGAFTGLFWDELPEEEAGLEADRTVKRRDVPLNRRAWQFSDRKEHFAVISPRKGE